MQHASLTSRFRWRHVLAVIAGVWLFPASSTAATASVQDVQEMADVCMYSQRILKDYALIGMGIDYRDPAGDLAKSSRMLNQYLANIESHGLKQELDAEVREIEAFWRQIEPRLLDTPSKGSMVELQDLVDKFSHRCEEVADHLAADTGIAAEHDVVQIAMLGMEVQRLAALYMMKAWDAAGADYYDKVDAVLAETARIFAELMAADESHVPAQVKTRLKEAEKHVLLFQVMAKSKSGRFVPTLAEKNASEVFHELRDILKLEKELVE